MIPLPTDEPLVIRTSPWKSLLLLTATVGFAAIGAAMLAVGDPEDFWPGLFVTLFFGAGAVVALLALISPPTLTLAESGFTHRGLGGRTLTVAWDDVQRLHLWSNPSARSQRVVAWTLKPGRGKTGMVADMNRSLGIDGALPGGWTMSPADLLALMERRRAERDPR